MTNRNWRVTICVAILVAVIGFVPVCLDSNRQETTVSASAEGESVVFHVQVRGANGILGLRVEDPEGKVIWHIDGPYPTKVTIVYGAVPGPCRQIFPVDNRRPDSIRGKRVKVTVFYQFDEWFAASSSSWHKTMLIP